MPQDIITFTDELERKVRGEFCEKATPEFMNLIRAAVATHEHAFAGYEITKEKYMEWISHAWDNGLHQRRVYEMEIEGSINNSIGVSMNFGARLDLFGKREGYISQEDF